VYRIAKLASKFQIENFELISEIKEKFIGFGLFNHSFIKDYFDRKLLESVDKYFEDVNYQ
jgi:hypothetical protein